MKSGKKAENGIFADNKLIKPFEKVQATYLVDAFNVGKEVTQTFKIKRQETLRKFRQQEVYALSLALK